MLEKFRVLILLFIVHKVVSTDTRNHTVYDADNFEDGFDGWKSDNSSAWRRVSLMALRLRYGFVPQPPDATSRFVVTPQSTGGRNSLMYKEITVGSATSTDLEIRFSCLVLGWQESPNPVVRLRNPLLQILYDDLVVFDLTSAIIENRDSYSPQMWNRFKLVSRYAESLFAYTYNSFSHAHCT